MTLTSWRSGETERAQDHFSVLVHGGAGDVPEALRPSHAEGCALAAARAAHLLAAGASALDAVLAAVEALEDDPRFNAGTGGALNLDAALELDASVMCGSSLRAGAVCALQGFKNPCLVARAALEHGEHVLYAAEGARRFARAAGFQESSQAALVTELSRAKLAAALEGGQAKNWAGGTVGAVARDRFGHLAAATSTGGTAGKHPGRVGDSPVIGAGTYADDSLGACSATGYGEGILRAVASFRAAERARSRGAEGAAVELVAELESRFAAPAGLILVAPDGSLGWARSTPSMSFAAAWSGGQPVSGY